MNVSFFVAGVPQPQGSTRAFVVKGRAVTTSANPKNAPWRAVVQHAFQQQFAEKIEGHVRVRLTFILPRPKSLPKTRPTPQHTKKPDLDKLVRSCFDAGKGVAWVDDSYIASVAAAKRYALIGEQTGVHVEVRW